LHSSLRGETPLVNSIPKRTGAKRLLVCTRRRGTLRAASAEEVLCAARQLMRDRMRPGVTLSSVATVRDFLRFQLGRLEHESFGVVMLDAQHRLIAYRKLFRGTLSHSAVHAREVVKEALACNAAGVILCHNHPSGWVEPSARDVEVTRALQQSLALVDIHVIDHLVVAGFEVTSFLERGLL
jgi:DNA repair protein RadC